MPPSNYVKQLRTKIGKDLLLCPAVAAVIPNDAGEILLQQKSFGEGWSLPAGAIEPGETPVQAVVREVREETALEVKPSKLLGVYGGGAFRYVYPNGDTVEYTVVLYLCSVLESLQRELDQETMALKYFDEDTMPRLALPYPIKVLFSHKLSSSG